MSRMLLGVVLAGCVGGFVVRTGGKDDVGDTACSSAAGDVGQATRGLAAMRAMAGLTVVERSAEGRFW